MQANGRERGRAGQQRGTRVVQITDRQASRYAAMTKKMHAWEGLDYFPLPVPGALFQLAARDRGSGVT
jgi:hypothetical protein